MVRLNNTEQLYQIAAELKKQQEDDINQFRIPDTLKSKFTTLKSKIVAPPETLTEL